MIQTQSAKNFSTMSKDLNWRLKLANWLSGGALEKYQKQAEIGKAKCQQLEAEIDNLKIKLKQSGKELEQMQAQLQIAQGFRIELGQTQVQLQQTKLQLNKYQQKLELQQEALKQAETQLQQTQRHLAASNNWEEQIKAKIEVVEVERLVQTDFDALWGFGIGYPNPQTEIFGGSLSIRGWVLGKQAKATTVRVCWQQKILIETAVNLPRQFVEQNYPEVPEALNSGFDATFTVASIPTTTELEIQAVLEDKTIIAIALILLKKE
jgi:hypothetical protein